MKYTLSYKHAEQQFIDFRFEISNLKNETLFEVQLPAWRPGRYELGDFAKNIQKFEVKSKDGKALKFDKLTKDKWLIHSKGAVSVVIEYNYYAATINAGSTWLEDRMLYVNPVNCFLYLPNRSEEPISVELKIPKDFIIASGLNSLKKNTLVADNVQQLLDCPFIASNFLQQETFKVKSTIFHVWFAGECKPDWKRLKADFIGYTKEQIEAFGKFPVSEYHYLILARPDKVYHGVEHSNSTVISLGPGYSIFNSDRYLDLLAVSSHELYHTWNVKQIRPVEMLPYDFTKQNYSKLGYVYEGVTTYMGDLMLARSGGFSQNRFLEELSNFVQKHFDNFGRNNLSVAESSFDTWLDGYSKGIPNRKVSIYNEGALNALICDVLVRLGSKNQSSLDTVMRDLYENLAVKGIGYTESDYQDRLEKYSGQSFKTYFRDHINGTKSLQKPLKDALSYMGLEYNSSPSSNSAEAVWGLKSEWTGSGFLVTDIHPNSPAEEAGIFNGDVIIAINNVVLENNIHELVNYFQGKSTLHVKRHNMLINKMINKNNAIYYKRYVVSKMSKVSKEQRKNYLLWTKQEF